VSGPGGPSWRSGDLATVSAAALLFSLALGMSSVALPLLTLAGGHGPVVVGVLAASAALSQIAARQALGRILYHRPDRSVIALAAGLMVASCLVAALTPALVALAVANLLQGVARGCFWTATQTHVVRTRGLPAVQALARYNFVSNLGLLIGPALGGILSSASPALAMTAATAAAAVAVVPTPRLERLPPFRREEAASAGRIWKRPGVRLACWSGVTTGGWRALLGSYVPVLLTGAGQSATTIGLLVSGAYLTCTVGALVVGRVDGQRQVRLVTGAAVVVALGMAATALLPGDPVIAGLLLGVSGLGAGALQTVGPALAAGAVHPEERGAVLSTAGTFRAVALFVCPLGVAGGLLVAPLGPVLFAVSLALGLPGVVGRIGRAG
jgi:MFS family permease